MSDTARRCSTSRSKGRVNRSADLCRPPRQQGPNSGGRQQRAARLIESALRTLDPALMLAAVAIGSLMNARGLMALIRLFNRIMRAPKPSAPGLQSAGSVGR